MGVQPLVNLLRALGEPLNECPVVQADDLGGTRAFVHRTPADTQALGERRPLGGQIQVVGRHQLGVQPVAVQGRPAAVRSPGGVLDKDVGVVLGVAGAAHAVLEGHRHQPPCRRVAVGAVVVAADADAVPLHIPDADLEGLGAALGQQPPDFWAAGGGQQRHALGGAEAVVE
jgi:hypothetical protein